jgi:hypothetical protein
LFVLPTIPFLGATPDAVINAECIVEVKCPHYTTLYFLIGL